MQHSRLRLVDLNYHCHRDITDPGQVLVLHGASDGYAFELAVNMDVQLVKHAGYSGSISIQNIPFRFFKSRNRFWYIPFATHRYIKKWQPQFVLVQGFVFPLQVIALRLLLGKQPLIAVQHHGERPYKGLKKKLQQLAARFTDAYFFTGAGNATEWITAEVVPSHKCFELQAASTWFTAMDKKKCREQTGITAGTSFLFVGHLTPLKDPVTVLKAFARYIQTNPGAALYFIYKNNQLERELKKITEASAALQQSVHFIGAVPHQQLLQWYNACDYFISGSHRESCGYALLEAMACGCIPVVTAIPSFKKITGNGSNGFLFEAGNDNALYDILAQLNSNDREALAEKIKVHFSNNLSFKKIAADIYAYCRTLKTH